MFNILCPVDFSPCSLNALYFASFLHSRLERSSLHLITVQTDESSSGRFSDQILEMVEDEKYLDALNSFNELASSQIGLKLHPKFSVIHSNDKVSDVLKNIAEKEGTDLIVMGTEGANQWKKKLLGSTTQNVLEKVKCHVLGVPAKAEFHGIKKMALGIDYMYFNEEAFDLAYLFRGIIGQNLHVFDVNIANNPLMQERLEEIKLRYAKLQNVVFSLIDSIEVVQGITKFTQNNAVDLLILISKKYTFLQKLFERSYTEELVLHTNVPVLILKLDN
ncbi:MAG: universal stress protein [Saprospirales bacterium]|nr:MAG: universal stress protein [Saprospirales bacterium]